MESYKYLCLRERFMDADLESHLDVLMEDFSVSTEQFMGLVRTIPSKRELVQYCFRHFVPFYDKHMEETNHFPPLREAMKALNKWRRVIGESILDVSFGTGEALLSVADYLNEHNISVIANDLTSEMLEAGKKKVAGKIRNIEFTNYDAAELPLSLQVQTVFS